MTKVHTIYDDALPCATCGRPLSERVEPTSGHIVGTIVDNRGRHHSECWGAAASKPLDVNRAVALLCTAIIMVNRNQIDIDLAIERAKKLEAYLKG